MASLQPDLADQILESAAGGDSAAACIKLNRRSLGGLAFEVQFDEAAASAPPAAVASSAGGGSADSPTRKARAPAPSTEEIAEQLAKRLAEAELRREQQLAQRMGKIETMLGQVSEAADRRKREEEERPELILKAVEEALKAAEERRLGRMEEVKQRARGHSAKDRRDLMREQQEAAKVTLEAELERDIREKEARRKEQLEKIVQGAQSHLAKVEEVRAQRVQSGSGEAEATEG